MYLGSQYPINIAVDFEDLFPGVQSALLWTEASVSLLCGLYLSKFWPSDQRAAFAYVRVVVASVYYAWFVRCNLDINALVETATAGASLIHPSRIHLPHEHITLIEQVNRRYI